MKECFTCQHKESRELTKEERKEMSRRHLEETGKILWNLPEMEYTCNISGNKISQLDPACDDYKGDDFMEDIRKSMSNWAKKERQNLKKTRND